MKRTLSRLLAYALVLSALADADEPAASPGIPAVTRRMEEFVKAGEISGAVTLVADSDGVLHLSSTGMADLAKGRPMTPDTVFWIASMTKPVTAAAVMMMQDAGQLSVDDPVSKHLPEFHQLNGFGKTDVPVTIRQCLTHTSGLPEVPPDEVSGLTTLAEVVRQVPARPLRFEPGSKWQYCQSGINTAARIVEVVSGKSFPEFLEERLFGPLGMKDTGFFPDEARLARLALPYKRAADGGLEEAPLPQDVSPANPHRYPKANGGLFSTAGDCAKFARMIVRGGELGGRVYLKPETVKLMTAPQTGDLQTGFTPGNGWGLGWCVIREPQGVTATLSPGTFGHGGMFGTQMWIDPVKKRVQLLMVQRANFPNFDGSDVRRGFHEAVSQSLP